VDAGDFDFLVTPRGARLLAAGSSSYDDRDPIALSQRLRSLAPEATASQLAAIGNQVALRRRAAAKFGQSAERMYFTATGLEQATHPAVAAHRAARDTETGLGSCIDLGCGIGSDLIAFARTGLVVTGVDADDVTTRIAAANLRSLDLPGSTFTGRAELVETGPFDVVFTDPARRRGDTRVFDPRAFSPSWDFVVRLVSGPRDHDGQRAVVKLAPGLDHALIPQHVEAEWVSLDGDLREVTLWAPAAGKVRRRATVLSSTGPGGSWSDGDQPADPPDVRDVGAFVYEPDPAIVRAHLVDVLVRAVDGWLLDPHIAYVCADRGIDTALGRRYRVLEVLPFKEKALRSALRDRNIGPLTVKKRGVSVTPEELRRRLGLRGQIAGTLILTRTPRSASALLVEPDG
jgi:predicted RNA methylase